MALSSSDEELLAAAATVEAQAARQLEDSLDNLLREGSETLVMLSEDWDIQGQWRIQGRERAAARVGPMITLSWARAHWLKLSLAGGFSPVIGEFLLIREGIEPTHNGFLRLARRDSALMVSHARAWGGPFHTRQLRGQRCRADRILCPYVKKNGREVLRVALLDLGWCTTYECWVLHRRLEHQAHNA